jgi:hypothetical protein
MAAAGAQLLSDAEVKPGQLNTYKKLKKIVKEN